MVEGQWEEALKHLHGTVDSVFEQAARDAGAKTHLILADGTVVTYAETFERASRLAGVIRDAGIAPGDRVACIMGNSRALYEFFIAASLAGTIAVPINIQSTAHEVGNLITDCAPKGFVGEARKVAGLPESLFAHGRLRLSVGGGAEGWSDYEAALATAVAMSKPASRSSSPALIVYSSGTTGEPKGIVLRQQCLIDNARRVIERMSHSSNDCFVTLLPTFHLFGYSFDFLYSGMVQARMVVMEEFDPAAALDLIERHGITVLTGVPTMFARMFDPQLIEGRKVNTVRLLAVGGGPVSPAMKHRLSETIGIQSVETYGQTEITTVAATGVPGKAVPEGACGPVLPGFEIRVVDPSGVDVPVGDPGELLFKCPTFMVGYWNKPALTEQTLRDGWLHTGDVGKLDAAGNVYILDRIKDMIVANGFNIFPKEVENALATHSAVQSAAVVGLPHEIRGEDVHAFVVLRPDTKASAEELLDHCRERLARYKLPRRIDLVEKLPLTATGKIRRFKLRELAQEIGEDNRAAETSGKIGLKDVEDNITAAQ